MEKEDPNIQNIITTKIIQIFALMKGKEMSDKRVSVVDRYPNNGSPRSEIICLRYPL